MEAEAHAALVADGVPLDRISFSRHLEMRYAGQSYELTVELPKEPVDEGTMPDAEAAFHRLHARAYGHAAMGEPTMVVNVRVTGVGDIPKPNLRQMPGSGSGSSDRRLRQVFFSEAGGFVETPIHLRSTFREGASIEGPAVIEEMDSTTVIPPGFRAVVDDQANLRITPTGRDSDATPAGLRAAASTVPG
jgi:N-methylhydantoinase A